MRPIEMIIAGQEYAKYRIKRTEMHDGTTDDITYWIYFVRSAEGIWAIDRFLNGTPANRGNNDELREKNSFASVR